MKKIKLFTVFCMLIFAFCSINIQANENEDLICYYVENCEGELELVCVDPSVPAPCQLPCPPGCKNED